MKTKFSFRAFAVTSLWLLGSMAGQAETTAQLIAKGDAADKSFNPALALQSYLPAEKLNPNDVELLLSIARQYRHLMCDVGNAGDKLKYGNISLSYAKRAAGLAPRNSDAQLSPAITYGKMVPFEGKSEQVANSPFIKAAADRAIKLNPRNDTAWHVLGRWHQSMANITGVKRSIGEALYGKLPVGSNAEAVTCFNKAISLNPGRLRHYIELGRTYAQMGNTTDARKYLEKGLKMSNKEKDDYELKAAGKESLAALP
ncbi:MAG: tetratricopeptide repeat protein [Luteolibacter sp.]